MKSTSTVPRGGLILLLALVVCSMSAAAPAFPGEMGGSSAAKNPELATPNPAALYCLELGYQYEMITDEDGERGICILPNGERVDAWDFYRGKVAQEYSYCARQGYEVRAKTSSAGSYTYECAVCVDQQGNEIGEVSELMGLTDELSSGMDADFASEMTEEPSGHFSGDRDLPAYFNWCDLGGCSSIKNQGGCGSCWAFATVGPMECNILIEDAVEVDLSEQWLVSCNSDGMGCGGGWWAHAYHQWKTDPCGGTGAVLEADFPYAASDLPCGCPYPHEYFIENWAYVGSSSGIPPVADIKQALMDYGPLSVACRADGWSGYSGGIWDTDYTGAVNHGVTLVGWDDNQGTEGIWYIKNSWGPSWGESGYMRIEYGCSSIGLGAAYVDYAPSIRLRLSLVDECPATIDPGVETDIRVEIDETNDDYIPGTGTLYYCYDGGEFVAVPLTQEGGDIYVGTLPAANCSDTPEFYFSAEGVGGGVITCPTDAPEVCFGTYVGEFVTILSEDFETDTGWTVVDGALLTDGTWERGVPVGGGDRGDPPTDYDGSGKCFVTDNEDGNSDVDGGCTKLISPTIDASVGTEAFIHYGLWYTNFFGSDPHNDLFKTWVSNNDGTNWVLAETIGPSTAEGWKDHSFRIADFVTPNDKVRVRFDACDLGDGSVVEAGIDDFGLLILSCAQTDVIGDEVIPGRYALHANVPNPFSPSTVIRYELPRESGVRLKVFDVTGRVIRTLVDTGRQGAGTYAVRWDGKDVRGISQSPGVYFYRLEVGDEILTRKMIMMR